MWSSIPTSGSATSTPPAAAGCVARAASRPCTPNARDPLRHLPQACQRRDLADLWNATQRKGMTLVPLVMYFNHRGMAKIKIGIAKGKKNVDKRETQAKRDWSRQKQRLLKEIVKDLFVVRVLQAVTRVFEPRHRRRRVRRRRQIARRRTRLRFLDFQQ